MSNGRPFQGSLFAEDFLRESIVDLPDWQDFDELTLKGVESGLRDIFARFPADRSPNESQTEDDLIWSRRPIGPADS